MILFKGAKMKQWEKSCLFNKLCWENCISIAKELILVQAKRKLLVGPLSYTIYKVN